MITQHAQILKKLPPWLYKTAAQAWIDRDYPRHLFIETTAACNLTCSFCPREKRKDHMDWGIFMELVREATLYGPRSFSLHLFGEPLLYPRWAQAIRFIKQCNRRHTVLLTTNGTQLNREVDRLIEANPDQVLWSWRPEAVFTEATKEKLRKWGKFRVRFIQEVTPPSALEEWKDWPNQEGRVLHNYGGNISLDTLPGIKSSTDSPLPEAGRHPCYHLWLAPAVAWNGNILICCADPHHKEVLGQFPQVSVHQAWTGTKIRQIQESHLRGQYGGICSGCDVWKSYPDAFFSWQKQ